MWHDRSQNNEVSCSFRVCSRNLAEDQHPTELLDGYSLTRAGENDSKKLVHSVHPSAPFYLTQA